MFLIAPSPFRLFLVSCLLPFLFSLLLVHFNPHCWPLPSLFSLFFVSVSSLLFVFSFFWVTTNKHSKGKPSVWRKYVLLCFLVKPNSWLTALFCLSFREHDVETRPYHLVLTSLLFAVLCSLFSFAFNVGVDVYRTGVCMSVFFCLFCIHHSLSFFIRHAFSSLS